MNVMARRLTIITLMLAIFAILLTAAVEADTRRRDDMQTGRIVDCATSAASFCQASL